MMIRRLMILMVAVIGMFGSDAYAVYDAGSGRWLERDPIGTTPAISTTVSLNVRQGTLRASPFSRQIAFTGKIRLNTQSRVSPSRQYGDGANIYQYTRSSPSIYADPSGLDLGLTRDKGVRERRTQCQLAKACRETVEKSLKDMAWLKGLPDCPCSIATDERGLWINSDTGVRMGNPDGRVWDNPSPSHIKGNHDGANLCMRSKPVAGGAGQQCCYDASGSLITGGSAAGTPDKVSPGTNVLRHYLNDVKPFKECQRAGMVDEYLKAWPPNNGNNCTSNVING